MKESKYLQIAYQGHFSSFVEGSNEYMQLLYANSDPDYIVFMCTWDYFAVSLQLGSYSDCTLNTSGHKGETDSVVFIHRQIEIQTDR